MDQATALATGDWSAWLDAGTWDRREQATPVACGGCGTAAEPATLLRSGVVVIAVMPAPEGHGPTFVSMQAYGTADEADAVITELVEYAATAVAEQQAPAVIGDLEALLQGGTWI